ncbi:MAG: chemotaxis response regulator protein-glutamate methylesterase [Pseudomonadota bacterium]
MQNEKCLRILVVDDDVLYRKLVCDILEKVPGFEVAGTAPNGKIALAKIAQIKPDVLTLDIEMPVMGGLQLLEIMRKEAPDVGAIILSANTSRGGENTLKALELGAFDFVLKPEANSIRDNLESVKGLLVPKLRAFANHKALKKIIARKASSATCIDTAGSQDLASQISLSKKQKASLATITKSKIVAIGVSTGGPNALAKVLSKIPRDIGVPILVVQHMPPMFTQNLAVNLSAKCAIEVTEAIDGQPVMPNVVLLAPGGKQMKVDTDADGKNKIIRITNDMPENSCKPSADYLFRSIALHYGESATGVIMTGMGSDGTLGLKLMKRKGAFVIAQNAETCVVYGMPKEAISAGIVDIVVPLERIAAAICSTVRWGQINDRTKFEETDEDQSE